MVVVILAILSVAVSGVWMRRLNYSRRCHEETQFVVLLIMDELLWLIAGILVLILALYGLFCAAMNEPSFDEFAFMMLGNFIYYPLLFLSDSLDSLCVFVFLLWFFFRLLWKVGMLKVICAKTSHPCIWIVGTLMFLYMPVSLFVYMFWQGRG